MSIAVETKTRYTPEDLLAMPDSKSYELVDGQLLERKTGAQSSWVGGQLYSQLERFCKEYGTGWAFPADSGYQCFRHEPGRVRKPDASFIRYGRLPGEVLPVGWMKIPPDLAVEVLSPGDTAYEIDEKVADYQKAGVPLIWVVNPNSRTVTAHRGDGSVAILREDDELSGEDVIPGFRCPVREILPPREPRAADSPKTSGEEGPQ
jgi:Uma2 family endonuclease